MQLINFARKLFLMVNMTNILHEIAALESSLSVLAQASQAIRGPVDNVEFLREEVPLAIEDAQQALERLRQLASQLDKAA